MISNVHVITHNPSTNSTYLSPDYRSEFSNAVVSKKGMLMKDILSCGLGYNHIKKVNMSNYCKRTIGDLPAGVSPLPDFEVFNCNKYSS